MKKALLSVAMAAVISLSATAISSTVVGAVSSNLATPKISKTENVNGGVKISWNKVNKAEVYRVYYKGSKGWTRLADTTSTSYTDSKVASGKTYTYTVRCLNKSKNKFTSGYDSKGAKATFIATPKISKTENVNGGVKISWGKSNGAEKYRVYYKGSKGWTRMVDTTSTSYIDKDVSSGKNYTYTVRCINSSATKFTSGYDSKGKSVKYISAPAEHTHSWQDITKKVPYTESVTKTEYVEKVRTICNDCGADITGNTEHIFDEIEKGGKGSYRAEKILVPIEKTETVTKTKTEVVGRKCTECGEIEYY